MTAAPAGPLRAVVFHAFKKKMQMIPSKEIKLGAKRLNELQHV